MRKTTTAVLLSAFAFPGSGHLYLRSYARGIALSAISAAALFDFIRRAWHEAELIRAQLVDEVNARGVMDIETLVAHATAAVDRIDHQPFTYTSLILFACWIIAIVDSHRIGAKLDKITPTV